MFSQIMNGRFGSFQCDGEDTGDRLRCDAGVGKAPHHQFTEFRRISATLATDADGDGGGVEMECVVGWGSRAISGQESLRSRNPLTLTLSPLQGARGQLLNVPSPRLRGEGQGEGT